MHFHHFALCQLAAWLSDSHKGEVLTDCFSQNKNELVLQLESGSLRIGCHTPLTYIVPARQFAHARKNVVHLFEPLIGRALTGARVVDWERVLILEWEEGFEMILKFHGAASNVLVRKGEDTLLFRQNREEDLDFQPGPGEYRPEHILPFESEEEPGLAEIQHRARQVSPVFDKQFALHIHTQIQSGKDFAAAFQHSLDLGRNDTYFLKKEAQRIRFLLLPPANPENCVKIKGIAQALEGFLSAYFQYEGYRVQHRRISREIQKPAKKYKKVFESYKRNVESLEKDRNPEEIGHLIMANLHAIPQGAKSIEVDDFYTGGKTTLRLKPELNPQENAKRYYDKHKNRKGKLSYLRSQLSDIESKLLEAELQLEEFEQIPSPEQLVFTGHGFEAKKLREWKKQMNGFEANPREKEKKRYPFRTFRLGEYDIFVGVNAKNNDLLTFKYATKEDIWFHAKDVTGSHVIVKKKPGQNLPESVIEYAAGLAAFYSKRKNDALVPVQFTPRKYLRKRKGDPAGFVVVEREEVVMAEPVKG